MLNLTRKWMAAGVLAVASIPAVGFARTHRPMQAAPALMATTATPAMATSTVATTPVSKKSRLKAMKVAHKKLHAKRKAHTNLKHTGKSATKLHSTGKKHTMLHASKKKAA